MSNPNEQVKAFGMNQIIVTDINGVNVVHLPAALELGFEELVAQADFNGNDALQGGVTIPLGLKGAFKQGGFPLEAYALMTGHTLTTDGTTPNQVATLAGDSTNFPYFRIFGKSLGDEGDDIHIKIFKAKLSSAPKGSFKNGEFFQLETEFTGYKVNGKAYDVVANETAAELDYVVS